MSSLRVIGFFTLLVLSTLVPWYVLLVAAIAYALYWSAALELLLIAVLVDAYFGAVVPVPYYTLGAVVLLVVVEWLKPHLVIYNEV